MKSYPIEKYHFYTNDENKVVAVSTYEGKTVRGVAKCDPRDGFNLEKGKKLAAARCAAKIAKKRAARAQKEFAKAHDAYFKAEKRMLKMNEYREDAKVAAARAASEAEKLLSEM